MTANPVRRNWNKQGQDPGYAWLVAVVQVNSPTGD
jgi:hypothetical protein